jgi:hypothetical protein
MTKQDDARPGDSGIEQNTTGPGGLSSLAGENADVGLSGNQAQAQVNAATVQKSVKNAVHPIAVKRIAAKKGLNYQMYRDAYVKSHRTEMTQMSNEEVYSTNRDLCEQNPAMRIREPRYATGRVNLLREYVELQVLSVMAEPNPEDIAADSRMGLLLDASMLGMSLSDLSDALKSGSPAGAVAAAGAGGVAGPVEGAGLAAGGEAGGGPPIGAPGAWDKQHEAIQQRKRDVEVSGENAKLKSSGPANLTVLRYGDFASTTIPGERVPQDANFLMDRRLFDQNFSSDKAITDQTFFFHLPKKETQKIIRF